MFVHDVGTGPAIVFLPGLGARHTLFAHQIEALTGFRRIAVDLPGCGDSGTLCGVPDEDVLQIQTDSVAAALHERGIEKAHFVGVSYGGVAVQAFVLRHPELVASAVISDSFCDTTPRNIAEWFMMAGAKLQPLQLKLFPRSWWRALNRPIYAKRWPLAFEEMVSIFERANMPDLIKQRRVVNNIHFEHMLGSTTIPTLCIVGDFSRLAIWMNERIHRAIPGSQVTIIENSFDPSCLCQPAIFTEEVRRWVLAHE